MGSMTKIIFFGDAALEDEFKIGIVNERISHPG
jgi:hypothetical protein